MEAERARVPGGMVVGVEAVRTMATSPAEIRVAAGVETAAIAGVVKTSKRAVAKDRTDGRNVRSLDGGVTSSSSCSSGSSSR